MLWPLPAPLVFGAYCLLERALRTMYWTAAVMGVGFALDGWPAAFWATLLAQRAAANAGLTIRAPVASMARVVAVTDAGPAARRPREPSADPARRRRWPRDPAQSNQEERRS